MGPRRCLTFLGTLLVATPLTLGAGRIAGADDRPGGGKSSPAARDSVEEAIRYGAEAVKLRREGQIGGAIAAWKKKILLLRKISGGKSEDLAGSLEALASMDEDAGRYADAVEARREVVEIRSGLLGGGHWRVREASAALAHARRMAGLSADRLKQLAEATRLLGESNETRARGDLDKAITLIRRAWEIQKQVLVPEDPDTISSLDGLCLFLRLKGDQAAARLLLEEVLRLQKATFGEKSPKTALTLLGLGNILGALGDPYAERRCYEDALRIYESTLGEADRETLLALDSLGNHLMAKLNDYAGARPYLERSLKIKMRVKGPSHLETAQALSNLGLISMKVADYPAARAYYERALAIHKTVQGDQDPGTAAGLTDLGIVLECIGDYAAAWKTQEQALAIRRRVLGEKHPSTAESLFLMGGLLSRTGDYEGARSRLEQALAIRRAAEKKSPADDVALSATLKDLAVVLMALRKDEEARPLLEEAYSITEQSLGRDNPTEAVIAGGLGTLHGLLGNYATARKYYERQLAIEEKVLGERHPDTARSMQYLGELLLASHDDAGAKSYFERSLAARLRTARDLLPTLAEAEALAYVRATESCRDPLLSALRRLDGVAPAQAYAVVWDGRALATRALSDRLQVAGATPEARQIQDRLKVVRTGLAQLTLAAVPPKLAGARRDRLEELGSEKERLERELAALSTPFRRQRHVDHAGVADLAARLPLDAAVVDLIRSTLWEPPPGGKGPLKITPQYEAFVLRRATRSPGYSLAWLHLGPAEPIDRAARSWREALLEGRGNPTGNEAPERTLRRLVWEPIDGHLDGCHTVIVIPDGTLTAVPWSALPGGEPGSYLLEKYAIGTAASGQQFFDVMTRDVPRGERALLVGGVRYDAAPTLPAEQPPALAHRGLAGDGRGQRRWRFLHGSQAEVRAVAGLYRHPDRVSLLEGGSASEAALRQQMPGSRFVHLATHGFFADERFRSALDREVDREMPSLGGLGMLDDHAAVLGRNPLILSGIVLAGANLPPKLNEWGAPQGDDGILTAEEVAALDLSGTDLVVLSACETGRGEVAGGEGVLGLQRAFSLAGARTVVASLWQVDDEATNQLMALFYKNLWGRGISPLEALRQAQMNILKRGIGFTGRRGLEPVGPERASLAEKRTHARLWAAWVLSGNP